MKMKHFQIQGNQRFPVSEKYDFSGSKFKEKKDKICIISRKPLVYQHLKVLVCFGFLDVPKLKQQNLTKPHLKRYGFNLWT